MSRRRWQARAAAVHQLATVRLQMSDVDAPFTASMQAGEQRSPANRLAMSVWVPQLPELVMAAWKAAGAGGGSE